MVKLFVRETVFELLKLTRMRTFAFFTLLFPVLFYLMFGVRLAGTRVAGADMSAYMLATMGAMGVVTGALFGTGMGIAIERGQGWFLLKRTTPMPPVVYVAGKIVATMAFSTVVVAVLAACGLFLGHVHLPIWRWALLFAALTLGTAPFAAVGAALGFLAGPNSAPGVINAVNLPAAFAGGLWMPIETLPPLVGHIAPWLPEYHLARLALDMVTRIPGVEAIWHVLVLLIWTLAGALGAVIAYRRDDEKRFG